MKMRELWFYIAAGCVLAGSALAQQGLPPECGSLRSSFGPYDYRASIGTSELNVVESFHFTSNVESLRKGNTGPVGGELSYTLRAFPNHHRALLSMVRLGSNLKVPKAPGASHSVQCFLMRAETFQPGDPMVKVIFGHYLLKQGQRALALEKLAEADVSESKNANAAYNLGLAYYDAGEFGKALENAHTAYRLGFPLPGLRDKLKRAGKWRDAPSVVAVDKSNPEESATTPIAAPSASPPAVVDKED